VTIKLATIGTKIFRHRSVKKLFFFLGRKYI